MAAKPIAELILWISKTFIFYRIFRTIFAFLWAIIIYKVIPIFYKPNFKRYKGRWTGYLFYLKISFHGG